MSLILKLLIEEKCRRGLIPEHKIRKPTFHYYQSNHLTVQLAADNPRKCAALELNKLRTIKANSYMKEPTKLYYCQAYILKQEKTTRQKGKG